MQKMWWIDKFLNNHRVEKFILGLIVLNLLVFVLDSMQSFHNAFSLYIRWFEAISIGIFTIEYILRLFTLKHFKDVFKPMMLIDLMAVLPYYLEFCTVNTIFLRVFRLSRLLRIMKISRYSKAIDNIVRAFKSKKDELIVTVSIFAISILIASILMYIVENPVQPEVFSSIPKCFYFSIITFTSVGYGDISPISDLGKMLASLLATIGIGFHGLFIGIFSVAMMDAFVANGKCKDNEKDDN